VGLGILYLLRNHRSHSHWANRLVRMDVAEAGCSIKVNLCRRVSSYEEHVRKHRA
jgi:hypothetical protein